MAENPLKSEMRAWLPQVDFAVTHHGFAAHGRDYVGILQAKATYELTLTHVVECHYETRVRDDVWPMSWEDCLTDYAQWQAAGEPRGYVWGTNWSMGYPGLEIPDEDPIAATWAKRLGKPTYAVMIETDRFKLSLVFHSARSRSLSDNDEIIQRVLMPLPPPTKA